MKKLLVGGGMTVIAAAGALVAFSSVSAQNDGSTYYRATLSPLNGSTAVGKAELRLSASDKTVNVHIVASGLESGGAHVSHIHGRPGGAESDCPTIAQDTDGDGFVELAEGQVTYGPIIVDFMNIDPDQDGNVDFRTTVKLSNELAAALPLPNRHIVIHGRTVGAVGAGTPGEVDGTAGYKTVLPVLCGEIVAAGTRRDPMEFRDAPGN